MAQIEAQLAVIENSTNKIRELLERTGPASAASAALAENEPAEFTIKRQEALPDETFSYRWPTSMTWYIDATRYTVRRGDRDYVFVIGAEKGGTAADLDELRTVRHLRDADLKRADDVFASLSRAPACACPSAETTPR